MLTFQLYKFEVYLAKSTPLISMAFYSQVTLVNKTEQPEQDTDALLSVTKYDGISARHSG